MQRARRIGLTPKDLAARAGVNFVTVYRGLSKPGSTSSRNLQAFCQALYAHEIELRDYLLGLHPINSPGSADHQQAAE